MLPPIGEIRVLGIETSCDETAASVVAWRDGEMPRILSSIVLSQLEEHAAFGGVVPEIAARAHVEALDGIVEAALAEAGVTLSDVDAIAATAGPGLIGGLLVGMMTAKAIAAASGKPLIPINHLEGHALSARLLDDVAFPYLMLLVSGGHTQILLVRGPGDYARWASTIDDAIGEAFDKVGAILGLGHPGGPAIDRLAQEDGADDRAFDFPVSRLKKGSLDFSYSGLKTAVLYEAKGRPAPPALPGRDPLPAPEVPPLTHERMRDIAASFQRAAVRALVLKLGRAIERVEGCRTLIVGGGVSANTLVRSEMARFASEHYLELIIPRLGYCVDNAAMIAGLGARLYQNGQRDDLTLSAIPTTAC